MKKITGLLLLFMAFFAFTGCSSKRVIDVIEAYPEVTPDNIVWEKYPQENMFGLSAIGKCDNQGVSTLILAFKENKNQEISSQIISEYEYADGMATYGYFDFDECRVLKNNGFYYVYMEYESKIYEPKDYIFSKDNQRCIIDLENGVDFTYCDFTDDAKSKYKYQSYDSANNSWSEITTGENERPTDMYSDYVKYTELAVDESEYPASKSFDSATFLYSGYNYSYEYRNIYGEIEEEAKTSLSFRIVDRDNTVYPRNSLKLFKLQGDTFVDITPSDAVLSVVKSTDGHDLTVTMESTDLGELEEGDYRVVYEDLDVNFRMTIQTFEVW